MTLPVPTGTVIRLDAVGGVSGDMFVAAAVATWPELGDRIATALAGLDLPVVFRTDWPTVKRAGIRSHRFVLDIGGPVVPATGSVAEIRALFRVAALAPAVRTIAIGLLDVIAAAEAQVHGIAADAVHLHELADWDSIGDLVAAAIVIAAVGGARWVCPSLPLGGGTVTCAHGTLPVPAPATVILCQGATFHSDGIAGERVTPTGAAILAYLQAFDTTVVGAGQLVAAGYGAGTRDFGPLPNVLRFLVFAGEPLVAEQVAVLSFDIDDQSPEDLAIGLDRLRAVAGVLSVSCVTAVGKKGRICFRIEVLAVGAQVAEIANACFCETSTLGIRVRVEGRWTLARRSVAVPAGEYGTAAVKLAERPGPVVTAKVEADFLSAMGCSWAERARMRTLLETHALSGSSDLP